jgi:hypothetical protein
VAEAENDEEAIDVTRAPSWPNRQRTAIAKTLDKSPIKGRQRIESTPIQTGINRDYESKIIVLKKGFKVNSSVLHRPGYGDRGVTKVKWVT